MAARVPQVPLPEVVTMLQALVETAVRTAVAEGIRAGLERAATPEPSEPSGDPLEELRRVVTEYSRRVQAAAPQEPEAAAPQEPDEDDVIGVVRSALSHGLRQEVLGLLQEFNAPSVRHVPADQRAAFIARVEAL